ncbi:MAG: hypothetical protein WCP45_03065 [Verrucomicrobiota bacterium]
MAQLLDFMQQVGNKSQATVTQLMGTPQVLDAAQMAQAFGVEFQGFGGRS